MGPVSAKESLTVLASLTDLAPFLSPLKAIILLIGEVIESVTDNKNQCAYLLTRCAELCLNVDGLCSESSFPDHYLKPLEEFKRTLDKILASVQRLSTITPLRRFLQRQEISESIKENHRSIDRCVELFNVKATAALAFVATEHEAARQEDQAQLGKTLEQLLQNDVNILESLELRGDQIMEAVRGLRDTISRGITDAVQEQFATTSLKTLLKDYRSLSQPASHYWALSSLEILIEGEILGSGAFGTVYVGRWNGTRVAVKQLAMGTPRRMLVQEIDIWRRLQHPHIASFFRASIESSPPLLVSELYKFGNVMDYLSRFPEASRVNMCYETSLGMVFLHSQKVVHGDLKPANVLIDDAHRARIADFGLSKVKSSMTTQTFDGLDGSHVKTQGTKAFMAPERLRRGTMSFATDVYAFAMSIYQIMTDEAPFQHLPEEDIRQVVVVECERPERPEGSEFVERGLTDTIWELIKRCWADDREKRPKFADIVARLNLLNDGMDSPKIHVPPPSRTPNLSANEQVSVIPDFPPPPEVSPKALPGRIPTTSAISVADSPTIQAEETSQFSPANPRRPAPPLVTTSSGPSLNVGEKEKIKSVLKGFKILHAAAARVYFNHANPDKWSYTGIRGGVALVLDAEKDAFYFKVVDLELGGLKGVTWEHALADGLVYVQDGPFFHLFAGDQFLVGFAFTNESEGAVFHKKVMSRKKKFPNPPPKKTGKIDKSMIAAPGSFAHVAHMGYDPEEGFASSGVDQSWISLVDSLQNQGVTPQIINENQDFIKRFVHESQQRKPKPRAPPPPPRRKTNAIELPSTSVTASSVPPENDISLNDLMKSLEGSGVSQEVIQQNEEFIENIITEHQKREKRRPPPPPLRRMEGVTTMANTLGSSTDGAPVVQSKTILPPPIPTRTKEMTAEERQTFVHSKVEKRLDDRLARRGLPPRSTPTLPARIREIMASEERAKARNRMQDRLVALGAQPSTSEQGSSPVPPARVPPPPSKRPS